MMNRWLAALVSCTVLALAACGGQSESGTTGSSASQENTSLNNQAANKILRVGMNAEFAPFESLDSNQKPQGFDVDLLNALAKEGHFTVEFRNTPWDSLFPALANGDIDVVASGVTITEDRKKTMDFTEPYYQITQVVLVPASKNVQSVEDLKKLSKVGVVTGHTGDFAAQKIFGATSANVARFDTLPLLMKEIESGGVDAAISDSAVVANYVKNNSDKGFKIIQIPDFEVENYGLAVRKGDIETLNKLNEALKAVRANGEYEKIEEKYFAKVEKK